MPKKAAVLPETIGLSKAWLRFSNSIRSPITKRYQQGDVQRFMQLIDINDPDELVKLPKERLEELLMNYTVKRQEKVRAQSVGKELSSLWKFFDKNGRKELDWSGVRDYLKEPVKAVKDRPYAHEEIERMLKFADLRTKVAILLMASSGMRIGALPILKKRHLHPIERIYAITVYENTPDEYITYCTPECRQAIDAYLQMRSKVAGEILDGNSPLIREQFDPLDKDKVNSPKKVSEGSVALLVNSCAVRSGLRSSSGNRFQRKEVMLNHGFRKFFKKNARRAGVDMILLEYLMGHKSGNLKEGITKLMLTYDPSEDNELYQAYCKALDNLTIDPAFRLEKENVKLKDELKDAAPKPLVADLLMQNKAIMDQLEASTKRQQEMQEQINTMKAQKVQDAINKPPPST